MLEEPKRVVNSDRPVGSLQLNVVNIRPRIHLQLREGVKDPVPQDEVLGAPGRAAVQIQVSAEV